MNQKARLMTGLFFLFGASKPSREIFRFAQKHLEWMICRTRVVKA
jgi:hypothetical protein